MPVAATATEFLMHLRNSGLIEPETLTRYLLGVEGAEQMLPEALAERTVRDGVLTPFQAAHLLKGRYKNFFIGKYKVLASLGTGGMSQVFLGEHLVMKHRVALKLLPIKDSSDAAAVQRFLREARAAAAINHPNVVRAHDIDKADGKIHYLVMDFVNGVNLHELVRKLGPLAPEQAANYIAQAALGLQEIASTGLIHRDVKPSNLLLDREGTIRILDLGLASFSAETRERVKEDDVIFGTADYLAPEQAMNPAGIDARADLYGLGATMYFLLTGRAPYQESSMAQKLLAHQFKTPEPIPDLPPKLWDVLLKMMAKKPEERFQCGMDVVEALAPWASLPMPLPPENYFSTKNEPISLAAPTKGHGKTIPGGQAFNTTRSPASDILRVGASGLIYRPPQEPVKSNRMLLYVAIGLGVALLSLVGMIFAGVFK